MRKWKINKRKMVSKWGTDLRQKSLIRMLGDIEFVTDILSHKGDITYVVWLKAFEYSDPKDLFIL